MLIGIDANEANVKSRVGSNQYAFQILTQLSRLDKTNTYRIYLKTKPLPDMPPASSRWQYQVITPKLLWTQWRLPLQLYFQNPKPKLFLTLGHYAPRFSPVPTLICIMDLAYLIFPNQFLTKDRRQLTSWTKYSIKKAKHIFTISKASKTDIIKHYSISPQKISIVYPAITPSKNSQPVNLVTQGEYLLYLGTLQPRKNLLNLIQAFADIKDKYPNLSLVIAGKKGWLYQSIFTLVTNLSLENKVIFTDFVTNAQVNWLIKRAKLFILPSLYEGFGIPVLQAMALNTPVLVSKNSSLPEIVENTGTYIDSPFDDLAIKQGIIEALSQSAETRKQQLAAAQRKAKDFSWEKSARKVLEVLNELTF